MKDKEHETIKVGKIPKGTTSKLRKKYKLGTRGLNPFMRQKIADLLVKSK